jgi:hypothetical protein
VASHQHEQPQHMELLFSLSEYYEIEDYYIYIYAYNAIKRDKSETPSAFHKI